MVDINQYRYQIGLFRQKSFSRKFLLTPEYYRSDSSARKVCENVFLVTKTVLKIPVLYLLLVPSSWKVLCPPPSHPASSPAILCTVSDTTTPCPAGLLSSHTTTARSWSACGIGTRYSPHTGRETGNFWAKYLHGNIRHAQGVHNMHLNIRSLKNKVGEIKNIISGEKPTILGLSECELRKENIDLKNLKIPGYEILFPKSWEMHGFARIVVYVKKTFQYCQIHDLEDDFVQSIWIKGSFRNSKSLYICHAYREHASQLGASINNQKDYLNKFLVQWECATEHNAATEPNEVHVCGDMNLDYLPSRWLKPQYRLFSLTKLVQNVCNAYNFSQLVTSPTRAMYNSVTNETSLSCIDHIYCNFKHRCSPPRVIVFGASDHDVVSYVRYSKGPSVPARTIRRRSFKNFVEEDFLADIRAVDWTEVLATNDLDMAVFIFTEKFKFILNQHAPWIIFQLRKNYSPWLTNETKELMKERDCWKAKAKELASKSQGQVSDDQRVAWGKYKKLRNKINNMKGKEEEMFKKEKIRENISDTAKVWKCTKMFMGWKTVGTPAQLEEHSKLITSATAIAKVMNQFFVDKVKQIRQKMASVVINLTHCMHIMEKKNCKLDLSHITVSKVASILKNLSNNRSTALDDLDNYSVRVAAPVIAQPLHHIITLSVMQCKFPTAWKYAKVLPLHKKEDPLQKKNYRPVSILSPLSKVLEKLVYEQLYKYFTVNKILHPNLHGYRSNRSTQTALLQMYDRWVQAASQGQVSGAVLLDLSAAFDLVPPDILVKKLKIYGLEDNFLSWIDSYLTERYQGVWIDHVLSDFLLCEVGVPQGSILGPLLFMLYVNDLPFVISCSIDQYADDSTLHATGKTVNDINSSLDTNCKLVSNWMAENMLQLNAAKTHVLTLGTKERLALPGNRVTVAMDDVLLEENPQHREVLLGITINADLKWHGQIEVLQSKLKARLAGLAHVRYALPYHLRKIVSEGIFNSVLCYCLPLFGGCDRGELQDLQILQNKAAQLVTQSPPRAARNPMYDTLDWLTVNQLVVYHTVLAVYRVRTSGEPEYLADGLCCDNRTGHIVVKPTRLSLLQKSFKFRGAIQWNELPHSIRTLETIGAFKAAVKVWIKNHVPRFLA